jgi:hypothetical protein
MNAKNPFNIFQILRQVGYARVHGRSKLENGKKILTLRKKWRTEK